MCRPCSPSSAAMAGAAGALLTQTTQFVSPATLSFQRSADVLVILIIGGTGRLYGAFVGAFVFLFLRDWLAALSPVYWYFWIGSAAGPRRFVLPERHSAVGRDARAAPAPADDDAGRPTTSCWRRATCTWRSAGLSCSTASISRCARRAPRHHRSERRGQDDVRQPGHRLAAGRVSGDMLFNGAVITDTSPQQRVKAGIARTFQINTLFRALQPAGLARACALRTRGQRRRRRCARSRGKPG